MAGAHADLPGGGGGDFHVIFLGKIIDKWDLFLGILVM